MRREAFAVVYVLVQPRLGQHDDGRMTVFDKGVKRFTFWENTSYVSESDESGRVLKAAGTNCMAVGTLTLP